MGTAVVTGANRGIGLGLVTELLDAGTDVVAVCRSASHADELQGLQARFPDRLALVPGSADTHADIDLLAAQIADGHRDEGIELLIHNAATGTAAGHAPAATEGPLEDLRLDAVTEVMRVNVGVPLLLTAALVPHLARGATVVNVSSDLASFGLFSADRRGGYAYSLSKTALNRATQMLAGDPALTARDIRVVSVHPGSVRTRMGGPTAPATPQEAARAILAALTPTTPTGSFVDASANAAPLPW